MPKTSSEELEQLQIEELKASALERQQTRRERANRAAMTTQALASNEARQKDIQSRCYHKKGGKGVQMLFQGNDSDYALVKHTLSHGPMIVICSRCARVWEKPARLPKTATAEEKTAYRIQLEEFQWAINAPTDNEPSGTNLFEIVRYDENAA